MPAVERDNATAHVVHHLAVVGGHEHGRARAVDALEQVHDAAGGLRVQVSRGLVADEQRRAVHDGAGDGHALLLAAGELVGIAVELVGQAHEAQHLGHLGLDDVTALPDYLQGEGHVLEDGLVRQELEVLEHAADVAAQVGHAPVAHGGQILVRHVDLARGGLDLAGKQTDEGGLARPGMAHEEDELPGEDLQSDVVQGRLAGLGRVGLRHMVEGDDRGPHGGGHLVHFQHGKGLGQLRGHRCLGIAGAVGRDRAGAGVALAGDPGVTTGAARTRLVPFIRHSL